MQPRLVIKRVVQMVISIVAATVVVFILTRMSGDPVALLLPMNATPEQEAAIAASLGIDQPIWIQYGHFIADAVRGDFGTSIKYGSSALSVFVSRLPATAALGLVSYLVIIVIAIPAGVLAASRPGGRIDRIVRFVAGIGQSIPNFVLGTLLILLFGVTFRILPTFGMSGWQSFVLPVATMSFFIIAGLTRLTRSTMMEALKTDYVSFAEIKGASRPRVLWRHAFPNSFISVLAFASLLLMDLLAGSVVVETVFAWPGVGQLLVESIQARDFPVVQVGVLILSVGYIIANAGADFASMALDPRFGERS